jgi:hypothetical protein
VRLLGRAASPFDELRVRWLIAYAKEVRGAALPLPPGRERAGVRVELPPHLNGNLAKSESLGFPLTPTLSPVSVEREIVALP